MKHPTQNITFDPPEITRDLTVKPDDLLLPCPFCGEKARVCGEEGNMYVSCQSRECYCSLGESWDRDAMPNHRFSNEEEAISVWNRRAKRVKERGTKHKNN